MGSKISNTEWGLLIGAGVTIDLIQLLLDLLIVGVFFNPFIDIGIGIALPFYFKIRGMKTDGKRIATWIGAGLLETLFAGAIPLWTGDIVMTMLMDKLDKQVKKTLGQDSSEKNQPSV